MRCPRCTCLGALVAPRVLCVNRRCPCYHDPSRRALDSLPPRERYSDDHVDRIRRLLWTLENESQEAAQ